MTNNAFAYLFDETRYELRGVKIDRVKCPGIACTLKGLLALK
uniref:Double jelly roll-like domain-containing protein n=1 Tax=Rhodnius prolixus TaxID=13249 RepID=T1HI18_RHOPR